MELHKGAQVTYRLHAHVIFVTKYGERRFGAQHLDTLESILRKICDVQKVKLIEFNGEPDHVHILLDYHLEISLSWLANILKRASSRKLKVHPTELNQVAWRRNALWSPGYFVSSVGGAPIEVLK